MVFVLDKNADICTVVVEKNGEEKHRKKTNSLIS